MTVPRRSRTFGVPSQWVVAGKWPDTAQFSDDAPEAVAHALAIAIALAAALEGKNKSKVAQAAQIERSTLYDIIAGNTWPDTVTLAKLEAELGVTLWPSTPPKLQRHS
jgi:DNA-binding phage protein